MKNQGTALVIGSNVGSEAFYFSLWLRVRTIGVEILCDLNSIAENLRQEFEIPKHALEFVCEDALSESTSQKFQDAGIVWLDDQTFDRDLVVSLGSRLSQHVSPESTIITYRSDVLLNMVKNDGTADSKERRHNGNGWWGVGRLGRAGKRAAGRREGEVAGCCTRR